MQTKELFKQISPLLVFNKWQNYMQTKELFK